MTKQLSDDALERLLHLAGARPEPRPGAAERVRAAVHATWQSEAGARRTRRRVYATASLAAAAMIAVVVFFLVPRPAAPPRSVPVASLQLATGPIHVRSEDGAVRLAALHDRIHAGAEIETADDTRAAFRLINGTSLRIDRASRVKFERANSIDVEQGAVYVDSKRSGIEVRTRFGIVRDIGTRFEVRLRNVAVDVRVRDGVIVFDRSGIVHRATAGEQLEITAEGSVSRSEIPPYGTGWEWTMDVAPPFAIDGKTVADFLQWSQRETGLTVRYRSAGVQRLASSTVLHGGMGNLRPDVACVAILQTAGLRCSTHGGYLDIDGGTP